MKTALVTTTINVPKVLALYRKLDAGVTFFVAGDRKTPPEAVEFCASIPDCYYLTPDDQRQYQSSELIGWNTDSRRNIAVLEALKWGAEVIVSVDDDMVPSTLGWGHQFENALDSVYDGLCFASKQQWFDAGKLTLPPAKQRGLFGNECEGVCGV